MPRPRPSFTARVIVSGGATAAVALAAVLPAVTAEPSVAPARAAITAPELPAAVAAAVPATVPTAAPTAVAPVRPVAVRLPAVASARSSAMDHALSKLGARYRWGAAGPTAFDCSGLVYWSYRQAGLGLPRTSRAMSQVGTPVARADLQPGDLVFFYSPVSHVAIYIGGGKVVHASTSGRPVLIAELATMPFTTARRV